MRLLPATYDRCDEARELVSVGVDQRLSALDRARLESHLATCAECRAFQAESSALASQLRSAVLERPAFDVVLPRSRRVPVRLLQTSVAAVAVGIVAFLGAAPGIWSQSSAGPSPQISWNAYLDRGDELVPNRHPSPKPVGSDRIAL